MNSKEREKKIFILYMKLVGQSIGKDKDEFVDLGLR
jgi:hypothetical protein